MPTPDYSDPTLFHVGDKRGVNLCANMVVVEFIATLLKLIRALNDNDVNYAVVGGAAMNIHGLIRATKDIDLFVAPDHDNIAKLKTALREVWDDPSIEDISPEELCGDYPAVRYGPPTGAVYLDILTRLGEMTRFADLDIEEVDLQGVMVRVATPRTLFHMKKGTVRPIDHADARALREVFQIREGEDDDGR